MQETKKWYIELIKLKIGLLLWIIKELTFTMQNTRRKILIQICDYQNEKISFRLV